MLTSEYIHWIWLAVAIVLEILANIALKWSHGFKRTGYGLFSIFCVIMAFSALAQAVKGIDLAVAYALWGGVGVAMTILAGWLLFGQRLSGRGWAGMSLLLVGMIMLKLS